MSDKTNTSSKAKANSNPNANSKGNDTGNGNTSAAGTNESESILDRLTAKKIADTQGLIFEIAFYQGEDVEDAAEAEEDRDVQSALEMLDLITWLKAGDAGETDDFQVMETDVDISDVNELIDEQLEHNSENNAV